MDMSKNKIIYIVLGLLVLLGLGLWVFQLINGLSVTGMNNATSWGLYLSMFMLFGGLAAGSLIFASVVALFKIESLKGVLLPAYLCALTCICCAGLFIMLDLGSVVRVWRMIIGANPSSLLFWDMISMVAFLVVTILGVVWLKKGEMNRIPALSYAALAVSILLVTVEAWVFGLLIAKEWYSSILAPLFLSSSLSSGLALMMLLLSTLGKKGIFKTDEKAFKVLSCVLAIVLCIDAYFIICEIATMIYPGAASAETANVILFGSLAPLFWLEVVGGLVFPLLVLAIPQLRAKKGLTLVACGSVILGVVCKRLWLLLLGYVIPNVVGGNGITLGNQNVIAADGGYIWSPVGVYSATLPEILISVGVIALGILALMVLISKFATKEAK